MGAVSGVGNYISDGLFGDDDEPTTQRPTTTEGSWLLGGFISNILSGGKCKNNRILDTINDFQSNSNNRI